MNVPLNADNNSAASDTLSPEQITSSKDFTLWASVLFLLTLVAYAPSMRGEYLWDDSRHVSENRLLRSFDGLKHIWVTSARPDLPGHRINSTPQYYPLTHTFYWIQYQLWQLNPIGYHAVNILLHAASALLLWLILRRLGVPVAWLAAAIFAVHPVQVESVAWISEFKNVLSGLFFFASVLTYLRFAGIGESDDSPRSPARMYLLSLTFFLCALLSKTVACAMPAVMVIILWWKLGRLRRFHVLSLLPFFIAGATMGLLTSSIEKSHVGAMGTDWALSPVQRILIAGNALWFYVGKILWPTHLSFSYAYWKIDPANPLLYIGPASVLLAFALLFLFRKRLGRGPLAAALIFAGVLFPALGFFNVYPMRYSFVADHFQYIAGIPIVVLFLVLGYNILRRLPRLFSQPKSLLTFSSILVLVLLIMTWVRAGIFDSQERLWRDTLAKNPSSWMAHYNLGNLLYNQAIQTNALARESTQTGDKSLAELESKRARDQFTEAAEHYTQALTLRSDHFKAWYMRGNVRMAMGNDSGAFTDFTRSIEMNPDMPEAHMGLSSLLAQRNDRPGAIAQLHEVLRTASLAEYKDPSIFLQAGKRYTALGEFPAAQSAFAQAIEISRGLKFWRTYTDANFVMSQLMVELKQPLVAQEHLRAVLQVNPQHVEAMNVLGWLLAQQGYAQKDSALISQAAQCFLSVLKLQPDHPGATEALRRIASSIKKPTTAPATTSPVSK